MNLLTLAKNMRWAVAKMKSTAAAKSPATTTEFDAGRLSVGSDDQDAPPGKMTNTGTFATAAQYRAVDGNQSQIVVRDQDANKGQRSEP